MSEDNNERLIPISPRPRKPIKPRPRKPIRPKNKDDNTMSMCGLVFLFLTVTCGLVFSADLPTGDLLANWRADTGITEVGSGVDTWADLSGNGHDLRQTVDADRPASGVSYGRDSVYFQDDFMNIPVGMTTDRRATTTFMAMRYVNKKTALLFSYSTVGTSALFASNASIYYTWINGSNTSTAFDISVGIEVFALEQNASNVVFYRDSDVASRGADLSGTVTGGYVGSWAINNTVNLDRCVVFEIAVYDKALDETERNAVLAYFNETYKDPAPGVSSYIAFEGDSLSTADNLTYPLFLCWPSQMSGLADIPPNSDSIATSGDTAQNMAADTTEFDALIAANQDTEYSIGLIWAGTNDIKTGSTTLATTNALDSWIANAKAGGSIAIACTAIARGEFDAGQEQQRLDLNTYIRNTLDADFVVDLASLTELSDFNNTTYFIADKTHLTEAGEGVVAQAVLDLLVAEGFVDATGDRDSIYGLNRSVYGLKRSMYSGSSDNTSIYGTKQSIYKRI